MTSNIAKGFSYEIDTVQKLYTLPDTKKVCRWPDASQEMLCYAGILNSYIKERLERGKIRAEKRGKNIINTLQDVGIDIIVQKNDDSIYFVQCKNYETPIYPSDLGTFFMKMLDNEHKTKEGFVYHSNNTLSRVIKESTFDRIKFVHFKVPEKKKLEFLLFDYQQTAVNECIKFYENNTKGILTMPCGTGKTIISCFVSKQYDFVIFISPLRQFAEQNIERYKEYDKDREYLLISSDSYGTRDLDKIKEFIKTNKELGKKFMLSVTYKSCDIIVKLFEDKSLNAFIIIDEFHNLSYKNIYGNEKITEIKNNEEKEETDEDPLNVIINSNYKILYMSATPRIYELEGDDDCNVEILGDIIYKMDFKTAIEKGYIASYRILIPIMEDNSKIELDATINEITTELEKNDEQLIDIQLSQKCCFLFECIKKLGKMKCIIYFQNYKEIDAFIKCFNLLNDYYYFYEYTIDSIKSKDSSDERIKKINIFTNNTNHSFLCCVRILNEAIDIKKCNSIYITYTSKSKISSVQRMARAMRLDDENPNKKANIILWCDKISDMLEYISSIKEIDLNFNEKIRCIKFNREFNRNDKEISKQYVSKYEKFIIGVSEYRGVSWYNNLDNVIEYIKRTGEKPLMSSHIINIKKLGTWIYHQNNFYKKQLYMMKQPEIYNKFSEFLKEYGHHFMSFKEKWFCDLNDVEEYIIQKKERPSETNKDNIISNMGKWIRRQLYTRKNGTQLMADMDIYNRFSIFLKDHNTIIFISNEEKWHYKLEQCDIYILKNKIRPSMDSKIKEVQILGRWISEQKMTYKDDESIMKNPEIKKIWECNS